MKYLIIFLLAMFNIAGADEAEKKASLSHVNFYYDNDGANDWDRYYTFGLKFATVFKIFPSEANILNFSLSEDTKYMHHIVFNIGQQSFTPKNTRSEELQVNDRPYAGWLWMGVGLYRSGDIHLDALELQVGMLGPAAKGEEIMTWFHEQMGYDLPRGWRHQLRNELGFVLAYQHRWKYRIIDNGLFMLDGIPNMDISLGNIHTYLEGGTRIRLGLNLPDNFGMSLIKPANESNIAALPMKANQCDRIQFYLFGFAHLRAVIHNIFLDGNTFTESHSVDKHPLVGEYGAGLRFQFNQLGFSLSHQSRTNEFKKQETPHQYSSIILYWHF